MGGQRGYHALQATGVSKAFHFLFFFVARQPPVGQGLLIHEASRSHALQSVGLLWTINSLIAETST